MKLIDKYILTSFVRNFLFGLLCFVLIFILVDLIENIDKFIDRKLSNYLIAEYYLYFIPEIIKLITPVSILLATLFTTGRFISLSELTAMNSAGISVYRYAAPLLIFGAVVTLGSIYFNGWIVPYSNELRLKIERDHIGKNKTQGILQNVSILDTDTQVLSIKNYNENNKSGEFASVQIYRSNDLSSLIERYDSREIRWDSLKNMWMLSQVTVRSFDSAGLTSFSYLPVAFENEIGPGRNIFTTPDRINIKQRSPDEIVLPELRDFINDMRDSGQDVTRAEIDYYSKISFPFANIIVVIFGISLSINQRKGSTALQFGVSILVAFLYLGFVKISNTFGYNGDVSPLLTAWIANIVFLTIGVGNLLRLNLKG